ncbi:hypothetical protein [Pseudomonas fluorescens]|uniref:hypothetical protein n=1 Tax=Pseudomonas fluorescens TaxID=294 RepID=UPI00123F830F
MEGFANLDNPRTRRAWQGDLEGFCGFIGLTAVEEFCAVIAGQNKRQAPNRNHWGAEEFD